MHPSKNVSKSRRLRTAFTKFQLSELKAEFARSKSLYSDRRKKICKRLCLDEFTVKVWFQNQRQKLRKERKELDCVSELIQPAKEVQSRSKVEEALSEFLILPSNNLSSKKPKPQADPVAEQNRHTTCLQPGNPQQQEGDPQVEGCPQQLLDALEYESYVVQDIGYPKHLEDYPLQSRPVCIQQHRICLPPGDPQQQETYHPQEGGYPPQAQEALNNTLEYGNCLDQDPLLRVPYLKQEIIPEEEPHMQLPEFYPQQQGHYQDQIVDYSELYDDYFHQHDSCFYPPQMYPHPEEEQQKTFTQHPLLGDQSHLQVIPSQSCHLQLQKEFPQYYQQTFVEHIPEFEQQQPIISQQSHPHQDDFQQPQLLDEDLTFFPFDLDTCQKSTVKTEAGDIPPEWNAPLTDPDYSFGKYLADPGEDEEKIDISEFLLHLGTEI